MYNSKTCITGKLYKIPFVKGIYLSKFLQFKKVNEHQKGKRDAKKKVSKQE